MTPQNIPLGYVDLPNGAKAIYPMNDIFLNFTFENATHWEALRLTVNLIIEAYKQQNPNTIIKPIEGAMKVRTQFQHLLNTDSKTSKKQDVKITEDAGDATYVEFQNRAKPEMPIEIRSVEYFGLGISHSKGKLANQMWLLAGDVDSVLHGEIFTRYILKDEVTGNEHPNPSGIMYISLTKLSQEESPAGELALFLLGRVGEVKNEHVKKILDTFNSSFVEFKSDKEVAKMLTLAERYRYDGVVEGVSKGISKGVTIGADRIVELIKSGLSPDDALRKVKEESENMLVED